MVGRIRVPQEEIRSFCRMKEYRDGVFEIMAATRPIFVKSGWEDHFADEKKAKQRTIDKYDPGSNAVTRDLEDLGWQQPAPAQPQKPENIKRAARRAASRVRDLALANDMQWFVTLTLDAAKIDRFDIDEVTKVMQRWLSNHVQRHGLRYIIVPEKHQDGAFHFHGLCNDLYNVQPSGTWLVPGHKKPVRARSKAQADAWRTAGYQEVYNWEAWPLGFTTAVQLRGDYTRTVAYVCKYITKQTRESGGKIAGRWYFSGGRLEEPKICYPDITLDNLEGMEDLFEYEIPEAYTRVGIIRGRLADFETTKTEFTKAGK